MHVLYAGDGNVGGAADYLLAILRTLRANVRHVLPADTLRLREAPARYDLIILSDMPARHVPASVQRLIARAVAGGSGLLMVGGWASFSGVSGGWRGSEIERLLPVACRRGDDRIHLPGGALIAPAQSHPVIRALSWSPAPVICGLNAVRPKTHGRVILRAHPLISRTQGPVRVRAEARSYPLLILDGRPGRRLAALTTDLAPHWCGGLVDWGKRRLTLPVASGVRIEVGDRYVRFVSALLRWLARA